MSKSLPSFHLKLRQKLVEMKEGERCHRNIAWDHISFSLGSNFS